MQGVVWTRIDLSVLVYVVCLNLPHRTRAYIVCNWFKVSWGKDMNMSFP